MIEAVIRFVADFIGVIVQPPLSLEIMAVTVICATVFAGRLIMRLIRR